MPKSAFALNRTPQLFSFEKGAPERPTRRPAHRRSVPKKNFLLLERTKAMAGKAKKVAKTIREQIAELKRKQRERKC